MRLGSLSSRTKHVILGSAAACAAVLSAVVPAAGAEAVVPASTWPQSSSDAAKSNHASDETTLTAAKLASAGISPVYSVAFLPPFGECGGGNAVSAPPVASATRLYFFDGRRVKAYDLATGDLMWSSQQLASGTFGNVSQLALSGNRLYVGELGTCLSESDPGGAVVALNAATGAQVWTTHVLSPVTSLVVAGGSLVVGQTGSGATGPVLQVLNASSGGVVWSNDCDAPNAFVVGSTIVTASCGGVSLATGATRWTKPGATFFRGDPTGVSAPAIYGRNAGGALIAVRPDGTLKWRGGTSYSDVLAAGPVRLWTQCDGSDVCALNRTTGARAFKSDGAFGAGPTALASDFAIVDSSIVRADNGHFVTEFGSVERGYSGDDFAVANGHIIATAGRNVDVFVLAG